MTSEVKDIVELIKGGAKRWCFTWNNYPDSWKSDLDNLKSCYLIVGEEIAPTTGTPHLQGYCEFPSTKLFKTLKNIKVLNKVCWCKCNGTADQNITYCSKEGKVYEKGDRKQQGHRTDLDEVRSIIDNGGSMLDVAEHDFSAFVRMGRGLRDYQYLVAERAARAIRNVFVEIRWGPTGTGKTQTAIMDACDKGEDYYITSEGNTGLWWTGYTGQKYVIIDEFRCGVPLHQLLRILDKYPVQVPIHCGYAHLVATTIIITSNVDPELWYGSCDESSRAALMRRISKITHMNTVYSGIPSGLNEINISNHASEVAGVILDPAEIINSIASLTI